MPVTKYFEIMRDVIDTNIGVIAKQRKIDRDALWPEVVAHIKDMAWEWKSNRKPSINYSDPLCRIGYLYGIVPANANLIEAVLEEEPELEAYLDSINEAEGRVQVCALGGGPGTELLGLVKRAEKRWEYGELALPLDYDFLLLDQVNEWGDSWYAIRKQIQARFAEKYGKRRSEWPVDASGNFTEVNITDTSSYGNIGALFTGTHLFILSYIISEVFQGFGDLQEFVARMADQAPAGARFVFIDRKGQCWKDEVTKIAKRAGLQLSDFHDSVRISMDSDESKESLGKIFEDVGRTPRLGWSAFWAVGTKA